MEKPFELAYTELKKGCFPEELSFRTTAEIKPLEGVIGQERAVKAFDFGLAVKMKGYNIYMAGPSGTGKTTYARNISQNCSAKLVESIPRSEPRDARIPVWALPFSLAATHRITCCFLFLRLLRCFSSPGSLPDVMDWRQDN